MQRKKHLNTYNSGWAKQIRSANFYNRKIITSQRRSFGLARNFYQACANNVFVYCFISAFYALKGRKVKT